MTSFFNRSVVGLLKPYVAIILVLSALLSPFGLSFVPVLALIWYLYQWRWPLSAAVSLMTEYFIFFVIALLMYQDIGLYSLLAALPVLVLVNQALEDAAVAAVYEKTGTNAGRRAFISLF